MDTETAAEPRRPRLNPFTKAERRERIFENLRLGRTYADIAAEEGLSARRVRQIVSDAVQRRQFLGPRDHAVLQFVRLESAHAAAAEAIAAGDVGAIGPYLRVLDRPDRYQKDGAPKDCSVYDDAARERLLAKVNRVVARLDAQEARKEARKAAKGAGASRPVSARVQAHAAAPDGDPIPAQVLETSEA